MEALFINTIRYVGPTIFHIYGPMHHINSERIFIRAISLFNYILLSTTGNCLLMYHTFKQSLNKKFALHATHLNKMRLYSVKTTTM